MDIADKDLAAFYREQALRMLVFATQASNLQSHLELLEMASTFQRLAMREEALASNDAADFAVAGSA